MTMYEMFFQKLEEKITLTDEDRALISSHIQVKKLKRRQFLLQEGEVSRHVAFVTKGNLRCYTIDDKGGEHIVQFAPEGWTVGDLYSFITGEPATYNIDALEDSEVLLLSKAAQDELLQKVPMYERYMRLQIQNAYIALQRRLTAMFTQTTEERYTNLIKTYPDIVQRVPQHMIASYLGLTPETLSRTRRQISARK
jgi:CRP-like cAMP-binding protein